ncbi:hypothetical protein GGTG_01078 [Gaeumannomyces tritici R3-111a-1]|uniref:Uncharacterized protein n=1 Tax=Gaeumannomyces tritici (strain R3-111a-1) TaxID=644352 RepID=J3NIJ9_GAET3|nr:hypothetical protein GGTG_01078 [Gaeumannomyces tritici R3-111a-1]EJT81092.1 hypothetical protein GGTG_01078 [Gaeumannomyces tritici R3-111a-1]
MWQRDWSPPHAQLAGASDFSTQHAQGGGYQAGTVVLHLHVRHGGHYLPATLATLALCTSPLPHRQPVHDRDVALRALSYLIPTQDEAPGEDSVCD